MNADPEGGLLPAQLEAEWSNGGKHFRVVAEQIPYEGASTPDSVKSRYTIFMDGTERYAGITARPALKGEAGMAQQMYLAAHDPAVPRKWRPLIEHFARSITGFTEPDPLWTAMVHQGSYARMRALFETWLDRLRPRPVEPDQSSSRPVLH